MKNNDATISFLTRQPVLTRTWSQSFVFCHALHVEKIALQFGEKLGLSARELAVLSWGCIFHDIGKFAFPQTFFAQDTLSFIDYKEIQRHPGLGYIALREIDFNKEALEIVLYHHERYDGLGYPFGLRGEEIPLNARICSLADSFEVMLWGRNYQKNKTYQESLDDLDANSGTQFDPELVVQFINLFGRQAQLNFTRSR